jgi:hypothetical protein
MLNPYHYLFYYITYNSNRIRKYNSRESAILYLSAIVFFYTFPFIGKAISAFDHKSSSTLFFVIALLYGFLIVYVNKKYFEKQSNYRRIINKFENASQSQILFGRVVAWMVLLSSFIAFILILSNL